MVVLTAVFHSLIVKDKSIFTVTNGADPVRLLYYLCAMAFPVEGVALAIVNDVEVSASVLEVNLMLLVGGDMLDRDWE